MCTNDTCAKLSVPLWHTHPQTLILRITFKANLIAPVLRYRVVDLGFVRKLPALDNTALKIASKCSFTPRKLRFLVNFALSSLRSPTFRTKPRLLMDELDYSWMKGARVAHDMHSKR